ncbi:hypothetical protein Dimus_000362 [Dionaea muscipula]
MGRKSRKKSDGDLKDEIQYTHEPQMMDDLIPANLGDFEDARVHEKDIHYEHGPCGDSNMVIPPVITLQSDPPMRPEQQDQIEEEQATRMGRDGQRPSDDVLNLKFGHQLSKKVCGSDLPSDLPAELASDKPQEVDLAQPLLSEIKVKLPGNQSYVQRVVYEKRPKFCSICWAVGHQDSNCRRSVKKVWIPKSHAHATTTHEPQIEQENIDAFDVPPSVLMETGQTSYTHADDLLGIQQENTHDIPMENIAGCSDCDEQQMMENVVNCSPRQSTPDRNTVLTPNETDNCDPEGFMPVQKKGKKKIKKSKKDQTEHHQDRSNTRRR